jgi:REP element-mobilizing transposase RayT
MRIASVVVAMSRPPRIPGFNYRGPYRYFLTFCTFERRETFRDPAVVALVLTQFRRTARASAFAILAYCVMRDHVHLLVEGKTANADLPGFVRRMKQSSGQAYSRRAKQPLWQEGYYDRVLRPADDAKTVARYIVSNPIRAGLVRMPSEYPHIGSDVWSLEELINSVL